MNRPYDEDFILGKAFKEGKLSDFLFSDQDEYLSIERPRLDNNIKKSLEAFSIKFGNQSKMLSEVKEEIEEQFELDIEENDND